VILTPSISTAGKRIHFVSEDPSCLPSAPGRIRITFSHDRWKSKRT